MPLRFKLGGHPILSAHLNVETAEFEQKRPEIWTSCLETGFGDFLANSEIQSFSIYIGRSRYNGDECLADGTCGTYFDGADGGNSMGIYLPTFRVY
jgi:hypothetical protein